MSANNNAIGGTFVILVQNYVVTVVAVGYNWLHCWWLQRCVAFHVVLSKLALNVLCGIVLALLTLSVGAGSNKFLQHFVGWAVFVVIGSLFRQNGCWHARNNK